MSSTPKEMDVWNSFGKCQLYLAYKFLHYALRRSKKVQYIFHACFYRKDYAEFNKARRSRKKGEKLVLLFCIYGAILQGCKNPHCLDIVELANLTVYQIKFFFRFQTSWTLFSNYSKCVYYMPYARHAGNWCNSLVRPVPV